MHKPVPCPYSWVHSQPCKRPCAARTSGMIDPLMGCVLSWCHGGQSDTGLQQGAGWFHHQGTLPSAPMTCLPLQWLWARWGTTGAPWPTLHSCRAVAAPGQGGWGQGLRQATGHDKAQGIWGRRAVSGHHHALPLAAHIPVPCGRLLSQMSQLAAGSCHCIVPRQPLAQWTLAP